jgi:uncharacterized protein (TIGR02284 family)
MKDPHATEKTIEVLERLKKICSEVKHLMEAAAEETSNEQLKEVFINFASQKAAYAAKLEKEIVRLGGKINYTTEESGLFDNIFFTNMTNLSEYEEVENKMEKDYASAIQEEELLWEVIPVVAKQYYEIKESKNRMKILTDKSRKSHATA